MKRALALLLAVLVVGATVPAPVSGQDSGDGGLFDTSVELVTKLISNPSAAASGLAARFGDQPDNSAADAERGVRTYFNNHSTAFADYAQSHRLTGSTSRDVVRLTYEVDGETDSHIVQANVTDGEYVAPEIVETTNRTVDVECTLEDRAAKNAPNELQTVYEDYVATNTTATSDLEARLATQYAGQATCEAL